MQTSSTPILSDQLLCQYLIDHKYSDLAVLSSGVLCGLHRFNFTVGLVVGLTIDGYERRYCFERENEARKALESWDGSGHPSGPWIKCKGAGIDLLNPNLTA